MRSANCRSLRAGSTWFLMPLGFALLLAPAARAQTGLLSGLNPLHADSPGIHLYSVSVYGAYYSSPRTYSGELFNSGLSSDVGYGAGASIGWNLLRNGSGISILYSPSYNAFHRYSNLNAFNHVFSLNTRRRRDIGHKWRTDLSLDAGIRTTTEFLFSPSSAGRLSDVPATFDDLANSILTGRISNNDIAAILNGVALPESAAGIALFGDYYFAGGVQGLVSYAATPRLTISTSVGGQRLQSLPRTGQDSSTVRTLLRNSTSASGSVQFSYARSPRTSLNFDVSEVKSWSALNDGYSTSTAVGLKRILSRRWFMDARAGAGYIAWSAGASLGDAKPTHITAIGGLGLGYKAESYTVLLSANRSISDPFGLGAGATANVTAGGSWRPRGSGWALTADGGWQRYEGSGASRLGAAWDGRIALDRSLTEQTGFRMAYAIFSNTGLMAAGLADRSISGFTVSFYWLPGGRRRGGSHDTQ